MAKPLFFLGGLRDRGSNRAIVDNYVFQRWQNAGAILVPVK